MVDRGSYGWIKVQPHEPPIAPGATHGDPSPLLAIALLAIAWYRARSSAKRESAIADLQIKRLEAQARKLRRLAELMEVNPNAAVKLADAYARVREEDTSANASNSM